MGLDIATLLPAARALLAHASALTDVDLVSELARASMRVFERTEVLQPALTAVTLGAAAALVARRVVPDVVVGHSLGEIAAWSAAGALDAPAAVALAAARGRLMAREAAMTPGGLRALRMNACDTREALLRHGLADDVVIAAHNAEDETVVAGAVGALDRLEALVPCVRVQATGAWHSPAMRGAVEPFSQAIAAAPRRPMRAGVTFVSNGDGAVVDDDAAMPELLAGQLVQPVHYLACLRTLAALGVTDVVIPGPARVLRALCRKTLVDIHVHPVETNADLDAAARTLSS